MKRVGVVSGGVWSGLVCGFWGCVEWVGVVLFVLIVIFLFLSDSLCDPIYFVS